MHCLFRSLLPLSFVALSVGVSGCSADGAVSLTGSLGNVTMTVANGPLVTTISGGFDVYLELGERASGSTNVMFSAFSLVRADNGTPVLAKEHLSVVSSRETPLTIQPGNRTTVRFQIGDQTQPGGPIVEMEAGKDYANICSAGSLQIVGTLQSSLDGQRSTSLSSGLFTPSGC